MVWYDGFLHKMFIGVVKRGRRLKVTEWRERGEGPPGNFEQRVEIEGVGATILLFQ